MTLATLDTISTTFGCALGCTLGTVALVMLIWRRKKRPLPPINHVKGVDLPRTDDPRWEPIGNRPFRCPAARLGPIEAYVNYGEWGGYAATLRVDGVRWEGHDVARYAREVVKLTHEGYADKEMRRSMVVAQNWGPRGG
jgi:hypothetical protein